MVVTLHDNVIVCRRREWIVVEDVDFDHIVEAQKTLELTQTDYWSARPVAYEEECKNIQCVHAQNRVHAL